MHVFLGVVWIQICFFFVGGKNCLNVEDKICKDGKSVGGSGCTGEGGLTEGLLQNWNKIPAWEKRKKPEYTT